MLALLFALAAFAQQDSFVALESCRGLPCVRADVGSHPATLLLDFASERSYLSIRVARRMALETRPISRNTNRFRESAPMRLRVGNVALGKISFYLVNPSERALAAGVGRDPFPLPEDGALALDAFEDRALRLDLKASTLTVSAGGSSKGLSSCGSLSKPRSGDFGPLTTAATGFTIDGQERTAKIDTFWRGDAFFCSLHAAKPSDQRGPAIRLQNGLTLKPMGNAAVGFAGKPIAAAMPFRVATGGMADRSPYDFVAGLSVLRSAAFVFDLAAMKLCVSGE